MSYSFSGATDTAVMRYLISRNGLSCDLPVRPEDRVTKIIDNKPESDYLPVESENKNVPLRDILEINFRPTCTTIHTKDGDTIECHSDREDLLPYLNGDFCTIRHGRIMNLANIDVLRNSRAVYNNGQWTMLGAIAYEDLCSTYDEYCG